MGEVAIEFGPKIDHDPLARTLHNSCLDMENPGSYDTYEDIEKDQEGEPGEIPLDSVRGKKIVIHSVRGDDGTGKLEKGGGNDETGRDQGPPAIGMQVTKELSEQVS